MTALIVKQQLSRDDFILGSHNVYLFWKVEQVLIMQKLAEADILRETERC